MINYETMKQHLLHKIAEYDKQIEDLYAINAPDVIHPLNKVKVISLDLGKAIVNEILTWVEKENVH